MLFMSLPLQPPFAVSNCLPPASEMSCQTWTGLSFVCQGGDRLGVTTSKKEKKKKKGEKKWLKVCVRTGAVVTEDPLPKTFIQEGFKLLNIQISVRPDGIQHVLFLKSLTSFLPPSAFPKSLQISFYGLSCLSLHISFFSHDVEQQ